MDIITLPVEYNRKHIESRYRLVVVASQRARELSFGAKEKIQTKAKKVTTTAILETISGEIAFLTGDQAVKEMEKTEKFDYKKLLEEKRRPIEDLSELEKDLRVYLHERETAEESALDELFVDEAETKEEEE